jgi:hypothetical protein
MVRSLWNILTDGGETRKILDTNGHGTPGVSFDPQLLDRYELDYGDHVAVEFDEETDTLEVHFPPESERRKA